MPYRYCRIALAGQSASAIDPHPARHSVDVKILHAVAAIGVGQRGALSQPRLAAPGHGRPVMIVKGGLSGRMPAASARSALPQRVLARGHVGVPAGSARRCRRLPRLRGTRPQQQARHLGESHGPPYVEFIDDVSNYLLLGASATLCESTGVVDSLHQAVPSWWCADRSGLEAD